MATATKAEAILHGGRRKHLPRLTSALSEQRRRSPRRRRRRQRRWRPIERRLGRRRAVRIFGGGIVHGRSRRRVRSVRRSANRPLHARRRRWHREEANSPEAPPARGCQVMHFALNFPTSPAWTKIQEDLMHSSASFYGKCGNSASFPLGVWPANQGMR